MVLNLSRRRNDRLFDIVLIRLVHQSPLKPAESDENECQRTLEALTGSRTALLTPLESAQSWDQHCIRSRKVQLNDLTECTRLFALSS